MIPVTVQVGGILQVAVHYYVIDKGFLRAEHPTDICLHPLFIIVMDKIVHCLFETSFCVFLRLKHGYCLKKQLHPDRYLIELLLICRNNGFTALCIKPAQVLACLFAEPFYRIGGVGIGCIIGTALHILIELPVQPDIIRRCLLKQLCHLAKQPGRLLDVIRIDSHILAGKAADPFHAESKSLFYQFLHCPFCQYEQHDKPGSVIE